MIRILVASTLLLASCAPPLDERGSLVFSTTNSWQEVEIEVEQGTTLEFWQDLERSPGGTGSVAHVGQCWAWDIEVLQGGKVIAQLACDPGRTSWCRGDPDRCYIEECAIAVPSAGSTTVRARLLEPLACKWKLEGAVLLVSRKGP